MLFEHAVSELPSYGEQLDSKGLDASNILMGNPRFSVSLRSERNVLGS